MQTRIRQCWDQVFETLGQLILYENAEIGAPQNIIPVNAEIKAQNIIKACMLTNNEQFLETFFQWFLKNKCMIKLIRVCVFFILLCVCVCVVNVKVNV